VSWSRIAELCLHSCTRLHGGSVSLIKYRDNFIVSCLRWGENESAWYVGPLISLLYQSGTVDDDDCGAVGGKRIGRGNQSTRSKPAPVPLCLPQIPHELTWARTRSVALGSRPQAQRSLYFLLFYKFLEFRAHLKVSLC
jgi:hypothetical protein